ncbi:MAG: choice-of-anchor V domain-containing protein [Pyrinomonadaceae bacterium]
MLQINKITAAKLILISLAGAMAFTVGLNSHGARVSAASSGPSPSYTNAPNELNCTLCHISYDLNKGSGSVQIAGVPATYLSGQRVQITVTTTQGDAVIYGFQMTAIDSSGAKAGDFAVSDNGSPETQLKDGLVDGDVRQYVEHTAQGTVPTEFGVKSWTFMWTAPDQTRGRVDFYATGNGANSDQSSGGDYIYSTTAFSTPANSTFSVGGQVTTPAGSGLRNAVVQIIGPSGASAKIITNSFGFYQFPNVPAGPNYTLRVSSKRYRFAARQISVDGNLSDVNFTGLE